MCITHIITMYYNFAKIEYLARLLYIIKSKGVRCDSILTIIKKILDIILGNNILILQGRLEAEEETRLIEDTMAMIRHVKNFRGIELAVISGNNGNILQKARQNIANAISGGDLGAITIIGPATVVKEIKKNPRKILKMIELLLNK